MGDDDSESQHLILQQNNTWEEDNEQISTSCSWSINTDDISHFEFDAWDIFHDEYLANEKEQILNFAILGTSVNDPAAEPHMLSPPLIDSIKNFLPDRLTHYIIIG